MPSTPPALYILNESIIKIKSAKVELRVLNHRVLCTYLITRLQSGISSPSSATDVANCMCQTMNRPVQGNSYEAVELPLSELHQSDDLLSERYIDVADFARIGTN
jgi:hypothetical protein